MTRLDLSTGTYNWLCQIVVKYPIYQRSVVSMSMEQGARGVYKLVKHLDKLPEFQGLRPNPFEVSSAIHQGIVFPEAIKEYYKWQVTAPTF